MSVDRTGRPPLDAWEDHPPAAGRAIRLYVDPALRLSERDRRRVAEAALEAATVEIARILGMRKVRAHFGIEDSVS